jgi:hypothetical protein
LAFLKINSKDKEESEVLASDKMTAGTNSYDVKKGVSDQK